VPISRATPFPGTDRWTTSVQAEPDRAVRAVLTLLDEALAEMARLDRADLAERLRTERDRLDQPTCTVLVIGEFNKGKSSMINALLNARVCATDADVATAVPTVVRYANELCAAITDAAGSNPIPIDPGDVEGLVIRPALERTAGTERVGSAGPAAVEVGVPRALLRDGLVLVDTPGMGGGLHSAHAAATLRALAGADAVVFVTDAGQELSAAEVDLLRRATDLCRHASVAITKIDFYPEWRRIAELDLGHLRQAGVAAPLFPLSSPLRHTAVRGGDRALSAESGFPQLAEFLRGTVVAIRRSAAAGAAAAAHSGLSQLVGQLATVQGALTNPDSRQERIALLTEAKQRAEHLRSAASRWQQTLADRIGDMSSAVDYDITVRLRAMRHEAAEKLSGTDPRTWLDLEPWLYQRTNEALADHLRLILDHADEVADEVAARFGDAAWELRVQADVSGMGLRSTVAGEETGLAAVAAARASRVDLALGVARGSSVAVVATHAAGLVIGLALPVTLPIAALLAGVLGRVSWGAARKAQLRQLRLEAERAVGGYLDEIDVRARRDSRDSVRRVQQHLRDVFTEHATQLHTSAVRNFEVLSKTVRDDIHRETDARAELDRNGAELEELRALTARAGALVDELLDEPVRQVR
jgi:Dynamin family